MSKILKNTTGSTIFIDDTGTLLPILPETFTIPPQDYWIWAASSDIIGPIGVGDVVVNDGSFDLTISDGTDLIKGIFPNPVTLRGDTDGTSIGNEGDALKVVQSGGDATDNEMFCLLENILKELRLHSFHLSQITDTENSGIET